MTSQMMGLSQGPGVGDTALELRREGPVQHTVHQYSTAQPTQPSKWDGPIGTLVKEQGRACTCERVRV